MFELKSEQPIAGETKRFVVKTADKNRQPVDPSSIVFEFKRPDGSTDSKSMADMSKLADGLWELYYTFDQAGTWRIKVTVTGWTGEKEIEMDTIVVSSGAL